MDFRGGHERRPGRLHFSYGPLGVARLHLNGSNRILDNDNVEPELPRIEDCVLDAILGCQPGNEDSVYAVLTEEFCQA